MKNKDNGLGLEREDQIRITVSNDFLGQVDSFFHLRSKMAGVNCKWGI